MGVPSNIILPFVGVTFDNSAASATPGALNMKALLVGQKTSAGTGTAGTTIKFTDASEIAAAGGYGSMIHQMAKAFRQHNNTTDAYVYMHDDLGAGTAAAYTITVTSTSALAGELAIMIDGYRISVAVNDGDSATTIAAAIATAMNLYISDLPVTSITSTLGVVNFSAKNKGTVANGLDVRVNHYDGEVLPSGVTFTYAVATPGTGDPDTIDNMITALGDQWYQVIIAPYTDAPTLGLIETEMASRAGEMRQIDGVYISAKKDTDANLISFGTNSDRNSPYVAVVACNNYPNNVGQIASAAGAAWIKSLQDDAAQPIHRIELSAIISPKRESRSSFIARNSLAQAGLCTLNPDNGVMTEACVTMYLKNSAGAPDQSYQQLNTIFTAMVLRYRFVVRIKTNYPRAKLMDSSANLRPGQQVITPAIGRAEAVAWALDAEKDGLIENMESFKAAIVCQRSASNRNRLEWLLPPDFVNQFGVGSADMKFIL